VLTGARHWVQSPELIRTIIIIIIIIIYDHSQSLTLLFFGSQGFELRSSNFLGICCTIGATLPAPRLQSWKQNDCYFFFKQEYCCDYAGIILDIQRSLNIWVMDPDLPLQPFFRISIFSFVKWEQQCLVYNPHELLLRTAVDHRDRVNLKM
jgi:hypothetical protein